jgi:RHH-type proline utilization regulon transcriptional repressor/proline dehydrogenase/delta 1-pyrroline-5-carboxylate dehydrogenase
METISYFRNEPLRDFSEERNRMSVELGLSEVATLIRSGQLKAGPIIGGKPVTGSGETFTRKDPSNTAVTVGTTHFASVEHTRMALESCHGGFPAWRARPYRERAAIVRSIGTAMKDASSLLTALIIREAGKPWKEADADVAEAIDFCLYYADEMERLGQPRRTQDVVGEENVLVYQPRGVVAVISPWNFPLAITVGMAVAALVTGNTVVLKPSEQTGLIAHEFAKIVLKCGVPGNAFAFVPGRGEEVGRALVQSPLTAMIAFTGSRPVGLEIIRTASEIAPGQRGIKRVVAELGGKNAIIVDEDADFDDAIRGTLYSAFGFAGQKCSACSRLIVVGDSYEPFLARLAEAAHDIIVSRAEDPAAFLGPVIDEESHARILATIETGRHELTLLAQTRIPSEVAPNGFFVPPTIFRDVPSSHAIWREEIFGPVLACAKATSFEHALSLAVDSDYALTGGVFSRHPEHIERAKEEFRVGNLYINRGITGALVARQPFGGFAFSGIGSKAGGPDYLLQFMEPRIVTENTMRRGFTPDLTN